MAHVVSLSIRNPECLSGNMGWYLPLLGKVTHCSWMRRIRQGLWRVRGKEEAEEEEEEEDDREASSAAWLAEVEEEAAFISTSASSALASSPRCSSIAESSPSFKPGNAAAPSLHGHTRFWKHTRRAYTRGNQFK
eukprot:GHVT01073040.1.p1 GENE.GHVT01073040.1~~GHVT01073040.1.p1  ORF type:complete len:135 (+),score=33.65 GHVT01073040.1:54-458(+)